MIIAAFRRIPKNRFVKELFVLIDIHSHIIPTIDDGAASKTEAAVMLRLAAESGTTDIVATSHYYNRWQCTVPSSKKMLTKAFEDFKQFIEASGIAINVWQGAELFGVNNIAELARHDEIISINGSRYVLIEFDFDDDFARVRYCLAQLKAAGYVPIIAHPERYNFLQNTPGNIYWFLEQSCLLQINKGSPIGRYGDEAMKFSRWLLENRLVHCVASDCHSPFRRTADMSRTHEWISLNFGQDYARTIFEENPGLILRDKKI